MEKFWLCEANYEKNYKGHCTERLTTIGKNGVCTGYRYQKGGYLGWKKKLKDNLNRMMI